MGKNEKNSFGRMNKDRTIYDILRKEDIGEYVAISRERTHVGKLREITDDGYAILNPFQGTSYSKGYLEYVLVEGERSLKISIVNADVTPTKKEDVLGYIKSENSKLRKSKKSEKTKKKAKNSN